MNFSLGEILLVLLVALLVIKPEQMPDVAFRIGRLAKSLRQMMNKVKGDMQGFVEGIEDQKKS